MAKGSRFEPGWEPVAGLRAWEVALAAADPVERWFSGGAWPAFTSRSGTPLAVSGEPARGLVLGVHVQPDHEGPDHHIEIVVPWRGEWWRLRTVIGYDSLHWAMSSPDHHGWFHARLGKAGESVTLLLSDEGAQIFGQLEPYVALDLGEMLALAKDAPSAEREAWHAAMLDLLLEDRSAADHGRRVGPVALQLGVGSERLVAELSRRGRTEGPAWDAWEALVPRMAGRRVRIFAAD